MHRTEFNSDSINNILIIKLSSIGDVMQASPVADKLRKRFPHAQLTWVVETKSQDVIVGNSKVDEVIVWKRKEWVNEAKATGDYRTLYKRMRSFVGELRERKFDLAIDVQGLLKSGLVAWFSGAPWRVCYTDTRELSPVFANIKVKPDYEEDRNVKHRNVGMLRFLGIDTENLRMEMPLTEADREFATKFLLENNIAEKKYIVLNPSTSWQSKCWPTEYYAQVGDRLIEQLTLPVVILGAPSDKPMVEEIKSQMRNTPVDAVGKTSLKQLAALVEKAALFIGGDTGPLYIAEAVGTSTVSIFGPTDPAKHAPLGSSHIALVPDNCRFCYKKICGELSCLKEITPDKAFDAARQLLRNKTALLKRSEDLE